MRLDHQEIAAIFKENYTGLCRFLESLLGKTGEAQEIAQDCFLRLCRAGYEEIPTAEIRFWLFRVARNLALDELRRGQTRFKFRDIVTGIFSAKISSPEETFELSQMQKEIRDLLKFLPEHQRSTLLLREQEEMSYREIALVLNVTEAKVKVDIFRARSALRDEWQKRQKIR